jgi:hypothetical protein
VIGSLSLDASDETIARAKGVAADLGNLSKQINRRVNEMYRNRQETRQESLLV